MLPKYWMYRWRKVFNNQALKYGTGVLQMFHVTRGADGAIQSVSRLSQPESELLAESDPEIQLFFGRKPAAPAFDLVDAEFVRVIEDLIDTLIEKNVIRHTDLPEAAQKKLMLRKGLRSRMQGALDLLGNDDKIL